MEADRIKFYVCCVAWLSNGYTLCPICQNDLCLLMHVFSVPAEQGAPATRIAEHTPHDMRFIEFLMLMHMDHAISIKHALDLVD